MDEEINSKLTQVTRHVDILKVLQTLARPRNNGETMAQHGPVGCEVLAADYHRPAANVFENEFGKTHSNSDAEPSVFA